MSSLFKPTPVNLKAIVARASSKLMEVKNVQDLERRYRVWKLRVQGYEIKEIAATLDLNEAMVRSDIVVIAKRLVSELGETVEESRTLQIARLDALIKKYHPLAEQGNLGAASMVIAVETRRSKLLALDVPEQKRLDVTGIRQYIGVDIDIV